MTEKNCSLLTVRGKRLVHEKRTQAWPDRYYWVIPYIISAQSCVYNFVGNFADRSQLLVASLKPRIVSVDNKE
jgi:hypothetical protein